LAVCVVALGLWAGPAPAADPAAPPGAVPVEPPGTDQTERPSEGGVLTLQFDNDLFGGTDRHFTHGTRFAWMTPPGGAPDFLSAPAGLLPPFADSERLRASFSIGQNIFTPTDITRDPPDPDDRPYAGWLYAGFGLVAEGDGHLDNLELDLGVVGSYALAEEVQTGWHDLIDITEPEGWDSQLKNEPGVVLYYSRSWQALPRYQLFETPLLEDLAVDIVPHASLALGNVFTFGAVGGTIRFGNDLPNDYGPPRIRPSLPGTDFFASDDHFGWYLFAGVEGRWVLRNIFLDGNSFRDGPSVEKEVVVGDLQIGLAIILGPARLSYTHAFRSQEFEGQDGHSQFGSMSLSVRF
jgi:hypothetical protein